MPNGKTTNYADLFNEAVHKVAEIWQYLLKDIEGGSTDNTAGHIKDWNLDTGVDESVIDLWRKEK